MSKDLVEVDFAIIGAGIIGLSIARELHKKFPQAQITVFEQESYVGDHTSGRNSGVLHAGIYYPHLSLKHTLCLEGNEMWDSLGKELDIPVVRCGKWIVARNREEIPSLETIHNNALRNQVPGFREATSTEVEKLKDIIFVEKALFSSRTGFLDQSQALTSFKNWLEQKQIPVLMKHQVLGLDRSGHDYILDLKDFRVKTPVVLNCAGLFAIHLRKQLGLTDLQDYWVKGYYVKSRQKTVCQQLIYPVPLKNLKGLGVHLTLDADGAMKFGPNTVDVTEISYSLDEEVKQQMLPSIQGFFKTVDPDQLYVDYAGIRPKLKDNAGNLVSDFKIQQPFPGYWELLGIESPGFTAAPAIAKHILQRI